MSGPVLDLLAAVGLIGLVVRFLEASGRWLLKTAEVAAARGTVDIHARRGDLTGLAESRVAVARERRARRINGVLAGLLLLCLVLPLTFGSFEMFAIASPLWLLPWRSWRPAPGEAGADSR